MTTDTVGTLLKTYHVQRIKEAGEIISQRQLANEFGIDYSIFNKYYNDERQPKYDFENKRKLAAKLGDVVYEILGEEPPDPLIEGLEKLRESDDPEAAKIIKLISDWLSSHGFIRTK